MSEEDYYPRGGVKPSHVVNANYDKQENLFGINKIAKSKKNHERGVKSVKSKYRQDVEHPEGLVEVLSFKTIKEGMLVLGCIKEISALYLTIELPGLIFCTLQVNYISETFTRHLAERLETKVIDEDTELQMLNNIFTRGQFVPTKVLQFECKKAGERKVFLSIKPNDINANYHHSDFKRGMLIWVAIKEKADHGYILDIGVKHVRAMLPFAKVMKDYVIGEPLWCVIKSTTSSNQATTVLVSDDLDSVQSLHLHNVIPGVPVNFRAEKDLSNGLKGTIFTDSSAYVNEVHFTEPFSSKEKYIGETLPALILYVEPITNLSFLTLRTARMGLQPKLEVGEILPSQVVKRTIKGIFVKLSKRDWGFISHYRIRNSLQLSNMSDLKAMIETKYPVGSKHQCRIMDYSFLDGLYICTFEKHLLEEKNFSISDLKVGEIVKGMVHDVNQSGIAIKVGNLMTFATNEHLSNAPYKEIFKNKFNKGQVVMGRVWLVKNPSNIKLTLKTAFLESDVCLKNYDDAEIDGQYPGMVVKITDNGALLKFYNNVQGWLKQSPKAQHNFKHLLYEGQVVSAWVVDRDGTKLTLSLEDPAIRFAQSQELMEHDGKVFDKNVESDEENPSSSSECGDDVNCEEVPPLNSMKDEVETNKKDVETENGTRKLRHEKKQSENTELHWLVVGNEDSDAPDFEEERRIRAKAAVTDALNKLKPVNRKKKKEDLSSAEIKRKKRIKSLQKTLKKINDEEAVLFVRSYQIDKIKHAVLPGVQNFFDSNEADAITQSSDGDDDMDEFEAESNGRNKRKLSKNEQVNLVHQQEEYLRNKEHEFLNTQGIPQNVEQFDRRLLGEPNSSELWAKYVAFHIQSTEIDKARSVIRRALMTIHQKATQDRLNMWITYLNLESMYGTKETFDKAFEEAVRYNDDLTIYLEAIKILSDGPDADEKIKKAKGKFKQEVRMYIEIAKIYYKKKKLADARRLKDSALRTILDKKKHVPLIVQFAVMEFCDGEESHGEALFETILQSDPRRTDVWSSYVDQLVKKNKIDLARRVLQRAVAQRLNYKKMKILYKKYQDFEQKHGTQETQEHVKHLLEEYVSQFTEPQTT